MSLAAVIAALALSIGHDSAFRVINGNTDANGLPISPARICIEPASAKRCYSPRTKSGLPPFGLNATARTIDLTSGTKVILFAAESYAAGSGSLISISMLEDHNGRLINLLPEVSVTNQSEYSSWDEDGISAMPVFVTADFEWNFNEGETHYSKHRYRVTSYVYDKQAGRYLKRDAYLTRTKYPGLDDADEVRVLEQEKVVILHRLTSRQLTSK